jgi:Mrp family chromosome partitioning ATPase
MGGLPDVGHEVLWVLRDGGSGEVLVARSLLGATEKDLVPLLEEAARVCQQLNIPIAGVITDGQRSIEPRGGERTAGDSPPVMPFSLASVRLPNRLLPQASMLRKNSKNRYAEYVRLNGPWKGARMRRPRRRADIA